MKDKIYALIDIETTGGRAVRDRITEIAIVLHDGEKIIDTYETLLNPECTIPYNIVQLTGITQTMVEDAPKFYEVAKKVVEMTEGAIFVAHNVRFDYSFIREEFKRLGFTFTRKQLCTVRLSRKAFPGLPSYSLKNLIHHFEIKVNDRHRAMADTMAMVEIFENILASDGEDGAVKDMINLGIKESLLPKNLSVEKIHALPEGCGVYYFHDVFGEVVYVGKSKNIQKRVAQHFSKKTEKASKLQQYVHEVTYEITGSEMVALLLESYEIKRLKPPVNRAQRMKHFPYVIHAYQNEAGYTCLDVEKPLSRARKKLNVISEYATLSRAKGRLKMALHQYELCAKYCNLEKGTGACFDFHLKKCFGACTHQETVTDYNDRVLEAIERLSTVFEDDFLIIGEGRNAEEKSLVLVEEGAYRGHGFANLQEVTGGIDEVRDYIKYYPSNPETNRIVRRCLSEGGKMKVVKL